MGLFIIACRVCDKPFPWFSGNAFNQACGPCNKRYADQCFWLELHCRIRESQRV